MRPASTFSIIQLSNSRNEGNRNLLDRIAGYQLLRKPTTGEFISILAFYLKVQG